jgi:hypothetical protein
MTMHGRCRTTILITLVCASSAWAQQDQGQSQDQGQGQAVGQGNDQANPPAPTMTPDTRPLSGIESLGLGSMSGERSYVSPGFLVAQTGQSNAQFDPGGHPGFGAATILAGNVALESLGRRNQFSLAYQGGGILYETDSQYNSTYQLFGFTDSVSFRRAVFTLTDRFSYLPGFYGGLGALSYGGALSLEGLGTLPGLNGGMNPQRGILTNASGYSNVVLAQLEYMPGARSSVTVAAGFQNLDSSQQGFSSFNAITAQTGYNRNLTAKDTVAVYYLLRLFHYTGTAEDINSQVLSFSYGRRVTDRLALQLFGGPEFFAITVPGHTQTSTTAYGGAELTYRWPRTRLGVNYFKGISGGSGALYGANTNAVTMTIGRQLSSKWSGDLGFGYNHNSSLQQVTTAPVRTYNYWHGTCSVARSLGRHSRASLFYTFQTQSSNELFTLGGSAGKSVTNNIIGVNFDYTFRPLGI